MIQHKDEKGHDVLLIAIHFNNKDIVELIWNEIKQHLDVEGELAQLVKNIDKSAQNFNVSTSIKMKTEFEDSWKKFIKKYETLRVLKTFKLVLSQKISLRSFKVHHELTKCDNLECHKDLWKLMFENFEDKAELADMLLKKNDIGRNFIHHLILNSEIEVIKFSFEILKENFLGHQYQKFLTTMEGKWERNLLQFAAIECRNLKIFAFLWKLIQDFCNSKDEFLKLLFKVDNRGSNFFHLAASHMTAEIFDFMLHYLKQQITLNDIVKKIFKSQGYWKENLLQASVIFNKSTIVQNKIWILAQNNLSPSEIIELIKSCDRNGDNLLHEAVFWNTQETVEFTWKNIQKHLTSFDDQAEYLRTKGHYMVSLEESASTNFPNRYWVHRYVHNLNLEFKI